MHSQAEAADKRWMARCEAAGLPTQRTDAEWVARWNERPDLFLMFLRGLAGEAGTATWREKDTR